MDAGKSRRYDDAVAWLRRAKNISLASGRRLEWENYLESLLAANTA